MNRFSRLIVVAALTAIMLPPITALAQKPGGMLRVYHRDSPASMSIHEEATILDRRSR